MKQRTEVVSKIIDTLCTMPREHHLGIIEAVIKIVDPAYGLRFLPTEVDQRAECMKLLKLKAGK